MQHSGARSNCHTHHVCSQTAILIAFVLKLPYSSCEFLHICLHQGCQSIDALRRQQLQVHFAKFLDAIEYSPDIVGHLRSQLVVHKTNVVLDGSDTVLCLFKSLTGGHTTRGS